MRENDSMEIKTCAKESFSVIGKEGSTNDGEGFVQALWADANSHFDEIAPFAKKNEKGNIMGIWGLMSDFTRSYKPWEDFSKGLYLAGVEVTDNTEPPPGWVKWTAPAYEYLIIKSDGKYEEAFAYVLKHMDENNIKLAGAVFDFICPQENGQLYLYFPVRRL